MAGWIKIHRKMLANPVVFKDPDHLAVWMYLLLTASHKKHKTLFGGKPVYIEAGQLITGRLKIARETKVEQHKVDRILKLFKTAQLIEQRAERYGSIISILNWDKYQNIEQQSEQRVSNERATSEQRVSTIQECKEGKEGNKNIFKPPSVDEVRAYCLERKNNVSAEAFVDFYSSKGWMVGKNKMKDWKSAVRNWERYKKGENNNPEHKPIEPKRYPEFPPEKEIDAVEMPEEIRDKMKGMFLT